MKQQYKGNLLLLLTAIIWGSALVAQSVSMDLVGPFTFQCMRSILGTLALLPVAAVFRDKQNPRLRTPAGRRDQRVCGLICGVSFFVAGSFQQIGLCYTSPGKAGFITALYIVLVPLAGIFFGKRAGWHVWAGVLLALAGLYLLCVTEGFSIQLGDLLVFFSSFAFDHYSGRVDGIKLSCTQFAINALLSGMGMLVFETPSLSAILACWLPICYTGILSGGLAYTLQIIGQRYTGPIIASLLLSLESVFSVLFGWLLLNQALSSRELLGCALMFAAILLAQVVPELGKKAQG